MRKLTVFTLAAPLTACGGDGGSGGASTSLATGYFKDSNTQGMRYVSGGQAGVTGADGSFTYEVGRPVSFYLGSGTNLPLGTVAVGQSVVTPVDLVASGSTLSPAVQNLARFLMMLDTDNDPSNGIAISPAVQAAASAWPAPDFTLPETNFNTAVNPIVTAVGTADARTATLPTAAAARTHVETTLRCARSGGFRGTYSGNDSGRFGVLVDAATGNVDGLGYSNTLAAGFVITGTSSVSLDQTGIFSSGVASTGATYSGRMTSPDAVSGSWSNTSNSGTFSGARVGGALNAKYRYTGRFQDSGGTLTAYGLYTFDIDASNNVTGVAYDIPTDSLETLTGTVSGGTTLGGTTSSGAIFSAAINLATGTVTGTAWSKGAVSGTFTASGCQLN